MVLPREDRRGDEAVAGLPEAERLSSAQRGGVGVRLPGPDDKQPVFWIRRGAIAALLVVRPQRAGADLAGRPEEAERPGAVRPVRQRHELVRGAVLALSARPS